MPGISVFLDVDNLGGGKDYPHIDVSNVVLCYCTRCWFTNAPCVREIVRAVLRKKRIIALLEPESSDTKGGHAEAECRAILRGDEYAACLTKFMAGQVAQWAEAWGQPELTLPSAAQIEAKHGGPGAAGTRRLQVICCVRAALPSPGHHC